MSYKRDTNVRKSLLQWITDTINADGSFFCGDGSTMISVLDSFPVNPEEFKIPSLSVDIERTNNREQYDLGVDGRYPYSVIIDMWFQAKISAEYIAALLKDDTYASGIEYRDYNLNVDGACILSYMQVKNAEVMPMRIEFSGFEGDFRYNLSFNVELVDDY